MKHSLLFRPGLALPLALAGLALAPAVAAAQPADLPGLEPAEPAEPVEAAAPIEPVAAVVPVEAAPAPASADAGVKVSYDKGLTFESGDGDYELKLGLRSMFRFETVRPDGGEFQSRFSTPRLRLQLEGHAYGAANGYKVEFDFANKGAALLKDFYVEHAFAKDLRVRAGQWKKPFNRQELVSDFGSDFLERSIVNEFSGAGRDLGVAVHNNYEKSPDGLEWAVGVFNGASEKPKTAITCQPGTLPTDPPTCTLGSPSNVPSDFGPALVARVGWNAGGIKGYSESDLEGGGLRYAVGLSYRNNLRNLARDANDDLTIEHAVVLDGMVKVEGLDVTAAVAVVKDGAADAELGFYGQAGYMLAPKRLLGSVRFAQIPSGAGTLNEILGGVDYFVKGHSFKWMLDGGVLHDTNGAGTTGLQIRTQLQFVL
ncbi:MAG: porin [Kofleriaceae bacterium]